MFERKYYSCPYTTFLFFLWSFVSFNFFLLLLFLQDCPLCSLMTFVSLSLCNVLFFSFAFCLFRIFIFYLYFFKIVGVKPQMVFCLFHFGKNCPLGKLSFFFFFSLFIYFFFWGVIFILLFSLICFGFFYFYYFNSHVNI